MPPSSYSGFCFTSRRGESMCAPTKLKPFAMGSVPMTASIRIFPMRLWMMRSPGFAPPAARASSRVLNPSACAREVM